MTLEIRLRKRLIYRAIIHCRATQSCAPFFQEKTDVELLLWCLVSCPDALGEELTAHLNHKLAA